MLLWNMSNFIWMFLSCRPAFGLDPVDIIKPTPVTVALIRFSHGKTWDGPIRIQNSELKMVTVLVPVKFQADARWICASASLLNQRKSS